MKKSFQSLDSKNATQNDDIKANLLMKNAELFPKYTCDDINDSICFPNFPTNWNKRTSYLHIKKSKLSNKNFRPTSILSNVSKIYERWLYDQIATYFEHTFF